MWLLYIAAGDCTNPEHQGGGCITAPQNNSLRRSATLQSCQSTLQITLRASGGTGFSSGQAGISCAQAAAADVYLFCIIFLHALTSATVRGMSLNVVATIGSAGKHTHMRRTASLSHPHPEPDAWVPFFSCCCIPPCALHVAETMTKGAVAAAHPGLSGPAWHQPCTQLHAPMGMNLKGSSI